MTAQHTRGMWIPFYFDGYQFTGYIDGPDAWLDVLKSYRSFGVRDNPYDARLLPDSDNRFGFRIEHTGTRTLQDLFDDHAMTHDGP